MKLTDVGILVPYETVDGERATVRFRYRGEIDKRAVRKTIRKHFLQLGIVMSNQLLDFYIRNRSYDLNIG